MLNYFDDGEEKIEGITKERFDELLKYEVKQAIIYVTPKYKLHKIIDGEGDYHYFIQWRKRNG